MNQEFPDVQAGFRKGRGTRDQIANIRWIIEKAVLWITTKCVKFLERWEYQTTVPVSCEMCIQDKKQQLEPEMQNGLVQN